MTDPTDHDELRTLADKLDDIAQRAEEEHISGVRPALRKWDTDRLHAAADVLRDDLQRRQRAYLATKRLTAERDAERAARERAETEARQLREGVEKLVRWAESYRMHHTAIALRNLLAAVAEVAEDPDAPTTD